MEVKKQSRQELIEAQQQKKAFAEHKKNLKEVVDYLELEYKELFYRTQIPILKQEYFQMMEAYNKQQEEAKSLKETMETKLEEQEQTKPLKVTKKKEKLTELNPEE